MNILRQVLCNPIQKCIELCIRDRFTQGMWSRTLNSHCTAAEKVGCRAVLSSEAKNSCDVGVITSVGRMMTEYHRIVAGAPTDQIYKASNRHVKMHLRITPARRRTSRLTPTGVITVPNDDSDLSPTKNKAPTPSLKAPPVAAAPTVGGSTGNGVQVASSCVESSHKTTWKSLITISICYPP